MGIFLIFKQLSLKAVLNLPKNGSKIANLRPPIKPHFVMNCGFIVLVVKVIAKILDYFEISQGHNRTRVFSNL